MNAVIIWSIFLLLVWAMAYCVTHKHKFDTVQADADNYRFSSMFETIYGGTFRTPGYKLRHNAVMFVRPTWNTDRWEAGDVLVVDTEFDEFVRGGLYLFRQGKTYRMAECRTVDKIGTFPPTFNGHETLITHDCMGRVIGKLDPPNVIMF